VALPLPLGEGEFIEDFEVSLCLNITLITQSPEEQDEEEELDPRVTNNGRDNWVAVPFSPETSLREVAREAAEDEEGDSTRVSEMEIWRGREMSVGRVTEC
jgi:saccharopine dehydrogenase-like NADP-dependent oxidoreductase